VCQCHCLLFMLVNGVMLYPKSVMHLQCLVFISMSTICISSEMVALSMVMAAVPCSNIISHIAMFPMWKWAKKLLTQRGLTLMFAQRPLLCAVYTLGNRKQQVLIIWYVGLTPTGVQRHEAKSRARLISRPDRGRQPTDGCEPLSRCAYTKGGEGLGAHTTKFAVTDFPLPHHPRTDH
jgi:hypothetical protein